MAEPEGTLQSFALKHGDSFLVFDHFGDIAGSSDGFYRNDTRVLSRLVLSLGGRRPSLLGSGVGQDNVVFTAHMTNRPLPPLGGESMPEGVIHIERSRLLWEGRLYERIELTNFGTGRTGLSLRFAFAADFADMFEVRGTSRPARGALELPVLGGDSVELSYRGLDEVLRVAALRFSVRPDEINAGGAAFNIALAREERTELYLEIGAELGDAPSRERFRLAAARARWDMRRRRRRGATVRSASPLFNAWLGRSRADLALLTTELPTGPYPYAGIPWFSTAFGRDAIVTALQILWLDPSLARGVLRYLGSTQAKETNAFQDAQPGKIMHETRKGEMTALGELPFGRYYGGVDTTPLYVMLAGAYAERTGDLALIDEIWPALGAAMAWLEGEGDSNRDGFVDYASARPTGLANQGWKDSNDSVFHSDGGFPKGPIALVEVQGLAFAASRAMSELAAMRGDQAMAGLWRARAEERAAAAEGRFWSDELGFYGIALDGEGALCAVRGSNAGQLLFTGLPSAPHAAIVTRELLGAAFSNGWGLRTLGMGEARFNPMSYHNGSVWPHDTALCAAGMARYGERAGIVRLTDELFAASIHFDMRLPELYCGFSRRAGEPVIAYPVACLPQAWSSGAVFMLVQACLGIRIDGRAGEISIERPHLPTGIDHLLICGIEIGDGHVDLAFERIGGQIVVSSTGATARVRVISQV